MDTTLKNAWQSLDQRQRQIAVGIQHLPWELRINDPLGDAFHEALTTSTLSQESTIVLLRQLLHHAHNDNELHLLNPILTKHSRRNPQITTAVAVYAALHNKVPALTLCLRNHGVQLSSPLLTLALESNPARSPALLDLLYALDWQHMRSSPFSFARHSLWALRTSAAEVNWYLNQGARFDDMEMLARAASDEGAPFFRADCVAAVIRRCGPRSFVGTGIVPYAARRGSADVLRLLRREAVWEGMEWEGEEKRGGSIVRVRSPLYEAVEKRHGEVVELLLSFGADSRAKSEDEGMSPLELAQVRDDRPMLALLERSMMRSGREFSARF